MPTNCVNKRLVRTNIMKLLGLLLLIGGAALAQDGTAVPEINANSAGSAIALLSGVLVVLRSRRK
jgi:hypothetical protein